MKTMSYTAGLAIAGVLAFAALGQAQSPNQQQPPSLDPVAEAGRVIFEKTAGGVGCATCHGETAEGNEDVGAPNIQGKSSVAILEQLRSNPDMQFIKLTDDEVDQVEAYLLYLHDLVAH